MRPITKNQIRALQIAARQVGLRSKDSDGRYKFLLMQYKRPDGKPVDSCKQLDQRQYEDFMAVCESMGFRHVSGDENYYRNKKQNRDDSKSLAQIAAVKALASDLGWNEERLQGFCKRQYRCPLTYMSGHEVSNMIEALKAMLSRRDNTHYSKVSDVAEAYI